MLVLLLFVLLKSIFVDVLETGLFMDETLGGLIQMVNVIAKVLRRGKLEEVGIEGGHVRLNMVEEECLDQVAAVDADGDLLEKLGNGQVLRANAVLDKVDLFG